MPWLCIAFPCTRSTLQSTTNTIPQRLRQTKRPINLAERCKFRFNVSFSDDKCRWFFKKQGGGCSTHIGNCHLHPKQVKASSTTLDKDEYELVLQQLLMNIPITTIQALLEKRTDTNYSYDQLTTIHTKAAHTLVLGQNILPSRATHEKVGGRSWHLLCRLYSPSLYGRYHYFPCV